MVAMCEVDIIFVEDGRPLEGGSCKKRCRLAGASSQWQWFAGAGNQGAGQLGLA